MGQLEIGKKVANLAKKYRYAWLVLALGLVLMLLPSVSGRNNTTTEQVPEPQQEEADLAQRIEEILCQVQGAGKVKIMLTVAEGQKTVYQTDSDTSENNIRQETVIVTGADREQSGIVLQINPEKYLGAIVVCQGADQADVRLAITQAVSKATGLGADKISVLKMK